MKKLLFLIAILLFVQLAEAKTILYITNTSTDTPCSSMQTIDSLYCNRLVSLGYDVKVINDLHVRDNSTTWNEYAASADAMFLGSNNIDMANKSKYRDVFCGNISSKNKPVFTTSVNTWSYNDIEGCAFFLGLVNSNYSNNMCSTKSFKIAKTGFITEGYDLEQNITVYPANDVAKIYNLSSEGWLKAECIPPNSSIEFYPVLSASSRGVFWGMDNPSTFSSAAWGVFERTVLYMMNDSSWSVNAFALPSTSTVNSDVLIVANVTQNGKPINGTVNFTAGNLTGNLSYDGLWKSLVNFNEAKQYNIAIAAYSKSLRGSFGLPLNVGNSIINITSGNFVPNSNYIVKANVPDSSASYRILDPFNYTVIIYGSMLCSNGVCTANVNSMPNANSLILEITSPNGGSLKIITKENTSLSTDKDVYKPGDVMKVYFYSADALNQVNLTIIRPDGSKETPSPLQMDNTSLNYWNKFYTLGANSYNGTWIINVKTSKGEYNKSVEVVSWKPFAYLNKNNYNAFDNLILTFGTTDAYSSSLDIFVSTTLTDPEGNKIPLGDASIKGNSNYNLSYHITDDYPTGLSTIEIDFKDATNRTSSLFLNFTTNITTMQPSLFATPSTISIMSIKGKTIEKNITLENGAVFDAKDITANASGINMTITKPPFIKAKSNATAKIRIRTSGLSEGDYSGSVYFSSSVGDASVAVVLTIIGDLSSQASTKYDEVAALEDNITYLNKMWINTTDAEKLLNETKAILNATIRDYENGNYESAKAEFEQASVKTTELQTSISKLYTQLPDYSFIIWYFALAVVIVIVIITFVKVRGRKKKQRVVRKVPKPEPKKEETYYEPKGGEYRTEYY